MQVVKARNPEQMLPLVLDKMFLGPDSSRKGTVVERESRNGSVRKFVGPCTFEYTHPRERVLFWADRDANPFFHLVESLWMLAGSNLVKPLTTYVGTMSDFSDNGRTFHGAYGHRWRNHFGYDQLFAIAKKLSENPDDRQAVVGLWDPRCDLLSQTKDRPCNDLIFFSVNEEGRLDMTVSNRSNDVVWGAIGANAVHFSFLQEYMASRLGREVGSYWQVSNNMHVYLNNGVQKMIDNLEDNGHDSFWNAGLTDRYQEGVVEPYPLNVEGTYGTFDEDCSELVHSLVSGEHVDHKKYHHPYFQEVVIPIVKSHEALRTYDKRNPERYRLAKRFLTDCQATDWALACNEWILRREARWLGGEADV